MKISPNVTRAINKIGFKLKKHAPEILTGIGIGSGAACLVLSNKTTHDKLDDILNEHNADMEVIREESESIKKDTVKRYAKTAGKLAKAYGPALACGAVSVTCAVSGCKISHDRNVALAGAYAALDQGFKKYRENVKERYGDEIDKELRAGVKKGISVEETDEKGKTKKKKTDAIFDGEVKASDTARFFDSSCIEWSEDPEENKRFLQIQENILTERLTRKGYLFLNDVYKALGFQPTDAGQRLGWKYDPEDTSLSNCVSFGIFETNRVAVDSAKTRFINVLSQLYYLSSTTMEISI
jgi:hypothetical protein